MQRILSLRAFPTMREAHSVSDQLYDLFVKEHKRKPKVELFLSTIGGGIKRASWNKTPETYEIRCYHKPDEVDEAEWMRAKVVTL